MIKGFQYKGLFVRYNTQKKINMENMPSSSLGSSRTKLKCNIHKIASTAL